MRVPTLPHRMSGRSGMSMLELVVCSTILLVSVMAAAHAQLDANRLMTEAQQTNVAVGVVHAALESVLEVDLEQLVAGEAAVQIGGEVPVAQDLLAGQSVVLDTPGFDPAADDMPDSLEVRTTLTWTSLTGHQRQMTMAGVLR
ncbi:type IV pilus modification PilV family protein [Engelhardtia mirabilis]|uniref:Prepilin-type N-terminal cleavage/methylation domain-containing protein n=1 Tax=Engelhardtia mirabilis TaxID=2528011 RepID=A0A518BSP7_9BACT|nr:hypothetical protein Pla133_51120 [Planctomycetes bacterium Pla133]QDV04314.1 hypothetical protein Pla86_51090 [Planctomycetes bacterium Pla86]